MSQKANSGCRAALEWRGLGLAWDVYGDEYWHVQQVNMSAAGEGRDNKSIDLMLVHKHTHKLTAVHIDGKQHLDSKQGVSDQALDAKIVRCWPHASGEVAAGHGAYSRCLGKHAAGWIVVASMSD